MKIPLLINSIVDSENSLPPCHNSKTNNKLTGFLVQAGAGLLNKIKYLLSIKIV